MITYLKDSIYQYRLRNLQSYFRNIKLKEKDIIIVSGTPRGGTTWVNEVIASSNNVFDLWEPLHPFNLQDYFSGENRFWFDKYIPKDKECEEIEAFLSQLLKGELITERMLQKNKKFKQYKGCDKLLIKFCRMNEMMPWFISHFPKYKIIQIDRNPLAVVSSQMKHGAWALTSDTIKAYKKRSKSYCFEYYRQFEEIIDSIKHPEELLTVQYCLSVLPRLSASSDNLLAVKYENLYSQPDAKFVKILDFCGLDQMLNLSEIVTKPSSTTKPSSNMIENPENQLATWKKNLSSIQTARIRSILSRFGFNEIGDIEYNLTVDSKIKFFND